MNTVTFLTALKARLETLTYSPSLTGIYYGMAPDNTTGSYIAYSIPDNQEGQSMGASPTRWQDIVVTIDIFNNNKSPLSVFTIGEQLRALFNVFQPLGSSVPLCTMATRTSYNLMEDPDGGFHLAIDYTFTTEE